jgi:hypothetical protein
LIQNEEDLKYFSGSPKKKPNIAKRIVRLTKQKLFKYEIFLPNLEEERERKAIEELHVRLLVKFLRKVSDNK